MQFCPYVGRDLDDEVLFSDEHVVPYAIGGPNALTIRVSKDANSEIGRLVDVKFTDNLFVMHHRVRLDLRGQSGAEPRMDWRGELVGKDDDASKPARYRFGPETKDLWVRPEVRRAPVADGKQEISIQAHSEAEFRRIVSDINRKQRRAGLPTLDADELMASAATEEIEQPAMNVVNHVGLHDFELEFVKMALGFGHLAIGEAFSRSALADDLRTFIWEVDPDKRQDLVRGEIFPSVSNPDLFKLFEVPDHHVFALLLQVPAFIGLAFGVFPGTVGLVSEHVKEWIEAMGSTDRVWLVEPKTRTFRTFTLGEFIHRKNAGEFAASS